MTHEPAPWRPSGDGDRQRRPSSSAVRIGTNGDATNAIMVVGFDHEGQTGAPVERGLAHQAPGRLHLAVSLQVVDVAGGGWLLQRRAEAKALFAERWANTCCTHPAPSEDPQSAIMRRVREETGLVVDRVFPAGSFTYRAADPSSGLVEYEHDLVFVAVADTSAADPDPYEVSELALLPFDDAIALVGSHKGAPWAADVLSRSRAALDRDVGPGLGAGGSRQGPYRLVRKKGAG